MHIPRVALGVSAYCAAFKANQPSTFVVLASSFRIFWLSTHLSLLPCQLFSKSTHSQGDTVAPHNTGHWLALIWWPLCVCSYCRYRECILVLPTPPCDKPYYFAASIMSITPSRTHSPHTLAHPSLTLTPSLTPSHTLPSLSTSSPHSRSHPLITLPSHRRSPSHPPLTLHHTHPHSGPPTLGILQVSSRPPSLDMGLLLASPCSGLQETGHRAQGNMSAHMEGDTE